MEAVQILSHPFRLAPNGAVATVEADSDAGESEQIAVLALTRAGERPLVPGFGIPDPAFATSYPTGALIAGLATYGPPVRVVDVTSTALSDTEVVVEVAFD